MENALDFAHMVGIIDPRERRNADARNRRRALSLDEVITRLTAFVADRAQWYEEARERLGLKRTAADLKGPEGVLPFATFTGIRRNLKSLIDIRQYFIDVDSKQHVEQLPPYLLNTNGPCLWKLCLLNKR